MSIFLSINGDDLDQAEALKDALLNWGFNDVWYMSTSAVRGGEEWSKRIAVRVKKAKCCIVMGIKEELTFTQGIEVGIATAENIPVIPVVFDMHAREKLPEYIRPRNVRTLPVDLTDSKEVGRSGLINDLHPMYIPEKDCSNILRLGNLVDRASKMNCRPETKYSLDEIRTRHPKIKIRNRFERTVALATKRQKEVAVSYIAEHHESTDFVTFLIDGADNRSYDDFTELVSKLRRSGISDQIILRTFVLAESCAVQSWEDFWEDMADI